MSSPGRESRIRRVTWIGLGANLALSALKLAAGLLGHSRAVVADGVHSLSDCGTDVALLVGSRLWARPVDHDHPYGHARIETALTVLLGLALGGVGIGIGAEAIASIREPHPRPPGVVALVAAAASIGAKEGLYRWTLRVGREARSSAVVANAWHHRSDALSSVPAVLAVSGALVLPGWSFLDPVGAVAVCLLILQAAYRIVRPAMGQLVDTGLPPREIQAMVEAVRGCPGVEEAHGLRTRYLGPAVAVDLHIEVAPSLTVAQGHDIAEEVRHRLIERFPDVADVVVHVDPLGVDPDHESRAARQNVEP
ncbi:MAG: cation diffusion facilitator family transporter [Candidatus Brocadiia bacterium]